MGKFKKKNTGKDSKPGSRKPESGRSPGKKEKRHWGVNENVTQEDMDALDYSKNKQNDEKELAEAQQKYMGGEDDKFEGIYDSDDDLSLDLEDEEEEVKTSTGGRGLFASLKSKFSNLTGNVEMTQEELDPILKEFADGLIEKNVANDIAQNLCKSVTQTLLNQKTESFTSTSQTFKEAMDDAITTVLTPKKNIDILKDALAAKKRGEPYKIAFIGVNGVGKSTSLAKVAYYLKTKGNLSILIAACDNFRSGAVEQLKTHSRCLDVPVYDKGYKGDPAHIAKEAIALAKKEGYDVVLIDTAGRMQGNQPLMTALAKLVYVNTPDVTLFVGEALVGNEAIDQLTKFNQNLIDYSATKQNQCQEIDGIILTKFDAVDEKVGAAVSMVYTTGKPIVFIGVGEKYPHLKKLNPKTVIHALLN